LLQTARNIAIIALLALVVDLVPGGGNAAAAILTAITLAFLFAIAWLVYRLYHEQQMTLATLTDARRAILYGSVGAIALLIVGYDEVASLPAGVVIWIALIAGAVGAIFLVWRDAGTY
jgi:hypothetical protein